MVILIRSVTTIIDLVAQAPPMNTLELIAPEPRRLRAVDGSADLRGLIGIITTIIIAVAAPFAGDADLENYNRALMFAKVTSSSPIFFAFAFAFDLITAVFILPYRPVNSDFGFLRATMLGTNWVYWPRAIGRPRGGVHL